MVVRYMTVLTQLFVTMKDILSFYNFLGKDGPRIANWLSNKSPRLPRQCTLKKYGVRDEMMINSITDFSSNKKRNYNTMAEDVVKRKNIAKSIKNEKNDLQFVQGLISIMKVNDAKKWRGRIKNDLITKIENCTQYEFNASTDNFYLGR